jgi:hypothetical protein
MSDHDRDLQRRIRERAYALWQEAGSPSGRDQEFWHRALELEAPAHGGPHGNAANGGEPVHGDTGGNGGEPAHEGAEEAAADPDQEPAGEVAAQTAEPLTPWWRRLF